MASATLEMRLNTGCAASRRDWPEYAIIEKESRQSRCCRRAIPLGASASTQTP